MIKISVIVPTYKEPKYLDLCLKSLISNQTLKNEIIVVVDGFYELNKSVLEKYKDNITALIFDKNQGLIDATNIGVYNATNDYVMIINDDNVMGWEWDKKIRGYYNDSFYNENICLTLNQIEPYPSIYPQFTIKNFGDTYDSFDYEGFIDYTKDILLETIDDSGYTLPFIIKKDLYLSVGGWDNSYPSPYVVDVEFFLKLQIMGIKMNRMYNNPFYHFGGKGTFNINKGLAENESWDWFEYKWGCKMTRNKNNKIILLRNEH